MRNARQTAQAIGMLAPFMMTIAHAADLGATPWPWSSSDTFSDIPTYDWSGGYVAIMGGYNSTNISAGELASTMVDVAIPAWAYAEKAKALAKASAQDMTASGGVYSLHAGINVMMERLVVGGELEYGKFSPALNAQGSFTHSREFETKTFTLTDGTTATDHIGATLKYANKTQMLDFALLNGRAGYAFGRLMPYALIGVGVTRIKIDAKMAATENHFVDVGGLPSPLSTQYGPSFGSYTKNAYAATFSFGLGFEYALLDNVLLRAQYNYMTAGPLKGETASSNLARGGLALKF